MGIGEPERKWIVEPVEEPEPRRQAPAEPAQPERVTPEKVPV